MKKVVLVLLSILFIIPRLSFLSIGAGTNSYTSGAGASYMLDVKDDIGKSYYNFSDGREAKLSRVSDEDFIVIDNPYMTDKKTNKPLNNSTLTFSIDAANLTYKAINRNYIGHGVPEAIPINSDTKTMFIAFRIVIEDNSSAFSDATSTMRIALESKYNKTSELTSSYNESFYWLDLEDGSMTWAFTQSGYMPINKNLNENGHASGIEFTGDMNGYLVIPMKSIIGVSMTECTLVTSKFLRENFNNIVFKFRTGDRDIDGNPAKYSSWENKKVMIGDVLLVNNIDSFAKFASDKRSIAGEMYSPLVDDTAFYARRVGGYRSFDQVRVGDALGKLPFDPEANVPDMQSNRNFTHITTLPNGDRANELILNTKENSSVLDSQGNPYTRSEAMLSMYDTYDFSKIDENLSPHKHGVRTKGVASEIDLEAMKYFAFRIATRDGKIKNQEIEFSVRLCPASSSDSSVFRTTNYYLTEGDATYLDLSSLKTSKLTVSKGSKDGLISYKGNLDGYIIVPIERFNTKLDSSGKALDRDVIRSCWGAYYNYAYQGIYYIMQSGFENGKALYAGDVFFVGDEKKFIEVRTTDCRAVGHKPTTVPKVAATCTEKGTAKGYKCSVCGEQISGFEPIDKIAHNYKLIEKVEPTESSKGYEVYKCDMCSATINKEFGEKTPAASKPDAENTSSIQPSSDISSDETEQNHQVNDDVATDKDKDNPGISVIIAVAAAVLVAAGTVVTILLLRKKKK